jgi:hypothetical protein
MADKNQRKLQLYEELGKVQNELRPDSCKGRRADTSILPSALQRITCGFW